ncbi:ATP-dependent helicase [Leptolyngbya ohadii]|uniref:ATP-dependent helicase n=1 Tax=Leptolyngbya ohadii TaxID=1962290 RepID=UPI000B59B93F|nr:ATP-dependent helicase [Leptolyngbya ohadii]
MSLDLNPAELNPELNARLSPEQLETLTLKGQMLQQLRATLRPGQQRMADWKGGSLAVSAVPGSGKSTGMAVAAAILLAERYLQVSHSQMGNLASLQADSIQGSIASISRGQPFPTGQLLLVTFTRSAVANLKGKIRQYLRQLSLPSQGFQVYTLHGLALNIASRHPDLSGINLERLTLISPNQSNRLIRICVDQWIGATPQHYQRLLEGRQFDGEETERLRRQSVLRTEVLPELAYTVIHEAKSSGLLPQDLLNLSQQSRSIGEVDDYNVLEIAAGLYDRYQDLLQLRRFIDYDDMILAALRVLENDSARQFWRSQIYAVFEDEAQDSSPLQTRLLELLAADSIDPNAPMNLVRVGDPNQAINSTFTPADPIFFREFCARCQAEGTLAEMDQAGRSSPVILSAANFMLDWVNQRYKVEQSGEWSLPFRPQKIQPVSENDPQPDANPTPAGNGLELRFPADVYHTVDLMAQRIGDLLTQHPEARAAILVRENRQGRFIAERLRYPQEFGIDTDLPQLGITIYDVGDRDRQSHIPAEILALLQFLDRPHSPDFLKAALQVFVDRQVIPTQDLNSLVSLPEQFLYPGLLDPPQPEAVLKARRYCTALLRARLELPHFQIIPFLAMTLQYEQAELATVDKLAERLAQQTAANPSLSAVIEALGEIVRSERFEPVETDDPEERYIRSRQVTIITMHKAKGLDWDFVFIPFLHDNLIPGTMRVLPQSQFLGEFSLPEIARAQIRASVHGEYPLPDTIAAWERAKQLKVAEEFRLLYVAMTRAKRLLWMSAARKAPFTWSKPDSLQDQNPCPVLPALCQKFPQK